MSITWCKEGVLGYGAQDVCAETKGMDYAVVHACKHPCHRDAASYTNTIDKAHPHYLHLEKQNDLYLNLIDPPVPLFQLKSFEIFFEFVEKHLGQRPIVIHCNQGESRAPSLALLVMAKCLGALPDASYETARAAFEEDFSYKPGKGIETFLTQKWLHLRSVCRKNRRHSG